MPRWVILTGALALAAVALTASLVSLRLGEWRGVDVSFSFRIEPRPAPEGAAATVTEQSEEPTAEAPPELDSPPQPEVTPTPEQVPVPVAPRVPLVPVTPVGALPALTGPPLNANPSPATPANVNELRVAPTDTPSPSPSPLPPLLSVPTRRLVIAPGETTRSVTLQNAGSGRLSWRVTPSQAWIIASPGSGTLPDSGTVQVRVDRSVAGPLPRVGSLRVDSGAGSAVITIVVE